MNRKPIDLSATVTASAGEIRGLLHLSMAVVLTRELALDRERLPDYSTEEALSGLHGEPLRSIFKSWLDEMREQDARRPSVRP